MASSILVRAKKELQRQYQKGKALKEKHKREAAAVQQGAAVLAGSAVAALVDEKFATDGAVAEVRGVPTNALAGGAAVLGAALVKGMPFRPELAAFGLGMASTALYQLVRENVQFE